MSVALEKAQVAVLAERLTVLLDEVRRLGQAESVPPAGPGEVDDVAPLDQPLEEEFRVGTMALAWDAEAEVVVIEAQAQVPDPAEAPEVEPLDELDPDVDGPAGAAGAPERARHPRLHRPGRARRRRRSPALPAVLPAARASRSRLPAAERPPALR